MPLLELPTVRFKLYISTSGLPSKYSAVPLAGAEIVTSDSLIFAPLTTMKSGEMSYIMVAVAAKVCIYL